jgi:hypothetical protein
MESLFPLTLLPLIPAAATPRAAGIGRAPDLHPPLLCSLLMGEEEMGNLPPGPPLSSIPSKALPPLYTLSQKKPYTVR